MLNRRWGLGDWASSADDAGVTVSLIEPFVDIARPYRFACPEVYWPADYPPRGPRQWGIREPCAKLKPGPHFERACQVKKAEKIINTFPCKHGLGHKVGASLTNRKLTLLVHAARSRRGIHPNASAVGLPLWVMGRGLPGFVISPSAPVLCAYSGDGVSDGKLCVDPASPHCVPGCPGPKERMTARSVLEQQSEVAAREAQGEDTRDYSPGGAAGANELVINATWLREGLPHSIEAIFYVKPAHDNDARCQQLCNQLSARQRAPTPGDVATCSPTRAPQAAGEGRAGPGACAAFARATQVNLARELSLALDEAPPVLLFDRTDWTAPFSAPALWHPPPSGEARFLPPTLQPLARNASIPL